MRRFYRPELDVLRFVAFFCVFIHHSLLFGIHVRSPLSFAVTFSFGFGVSLFFVLSAYLITTLLLREKLGTGTISLSKFYKRRFLRICPLYFSALAAAALWSFSRHRIHQEGSWFLAAAFFVVNFLPTPGGIVIAQLWSISVEEQFYLILPAAIRQLSRRSLLVAACLIILAANVTLSLYAYGHAPEWEIWRSTFVCFEMFATGILLALYESRWEPVASPAVQRWVAAFFVPVAWFSATYFLHIRSQYGAVSALSLCVGYGLVAASCGLLLRVVAGWKKPPNWAIYLGTISYGLYVFHMPALIFFYAIPISVPDYIRDLFALIATLGLGTLSYRFFEMPFLVRKRKFEMVPSRPPHED